MKNFSFSLWVVVVFIIQSCSVDGDSEGRNPKDKSLDGSWQLIERMVDPGDGSGTLEPVQDGRVLLINTENATIQDDDEFCGTTIPVEVEITDEYFEVNCDEQNFTWFYEFEGELLVIRPQCIEGCVYKYEKLEE